MALVKCPDCGRMVSDAAPACPQCGRPAGHYVDVACPACGDTLTVLGSAVVTVCPSCHETVMWEQCGTTGTVGTILGSWLTWTHPECPQMHPVPVYLPSGEKVYKFACPGCERQYTVPGDTEHTACPNCRERISFVACDVVPFWGPVLRSVGGRWTHPGCSKKHPMPPDPEKAGDHQIVCPHCQRKGGVYTLRRNKKAGVSGGKATGAVLTAGVSLLATGLSRHERVTDFKCTFCKTKWTA